MFKLSTTKLIHSAVANSYNNLLAIDLIKLVYNYKISVLSIIERTIHYAKDRTESFDDYFLPCRKISVDYNM